MPNLQQELLALLDNEPVASCGSVQQPRQQPRRQLSRRGGSQVPLSDRSLPPAFKYWANTGVKNNKRTKKDKVQRGDGGEEISSFMWTSASLLQHSILIIIGVCIFFLAKMASHSNRGNQVKLQIRSSFIRPVSDMYGNAQEAQFSFLDSAWKGKEEAQYETLIQPSEIDFAIQRRLHLGVDEEKICDEILLYLPLTSDVQGLTEHLTGYLQAALLSTYMGKAMIVLDASPATGDCPLVAVEKEAMHKDDNGEPPQLEESFPVGLSRLIQHPPWLSHGCSVPCQASYDFLKWNGLREKGIHGVTCQNDNDRKTNVFAVGEEEVRQYFEQYKEQMLARPSTGSNGWALRLGAKGHEAREFSQLKKEEEIWDYVSALMARSAIIRFQPWIAKDVKEMIQAYELPLNFPYVAFHVHRPSQKVEPKGYDVERPLQNYLQQLILENPDCNNKAHLVYIATDEPQKMREEIDLLPKGIGGNTILEQCHKIKFMISSAKLTKPIRADDRTACSEIHRFNIASIADLMILAKSDMFIGDFSNCSLGRLVRIFRTAVNNYPGREHNGPVLVRNARAIFMATPPAPLGM